MRKFTKEISALIATISVGTAAVAVSSASEEIGRSAGEAAASVETTVENIPLGGVTVPPDTTATTGLPSLSGTSVATTEEYIEPTTEEFPPTAGVPMPPDDYIEPTTEEMPPLGGVPLPPDDYIEPTTTELPPTAGVPMPPDDYIEPTTTEIPTLAGIDMPTQPTTEEIPPLSGDVMPSDGDINADGEVSVSDAVSLQKWLLGDSEQLMLNWKAADLCEDDQIDAFDLCVLKKLITDEGKQK